MKFKCANCDKMVFDTKFMGTANRNHCPFCLWSKHVDNRPGDRLNLCRGPMEPIGLTFKHEGLDKYGKEKQGEIMLVHKCQKCQKVSINRIAGDDDANEILKVFEKSFQIQIPDEELGEIKLLKEEDRTKIEKQLFGNKT